MSSKQGIYQRLLAVILVVGLVFLFLIFILFFFKNVQERLIYDSSQTQFDNEIKSLVSLNSSKLRQIVLDYTYWDDLVNNIKVKDTSWFNSNISTVVQSFHFDYVCVYDSSFNLLHQAHSEQCEASDIIPPETLPLLQKKRFMDFYISAEQGVYEISSASVHITKDPGHNLTRPQGYFFIAKKWDQNYLKELSKLTGTEIKIIKGSDSLKSQNYYSFIANHKIVDFNNNIVATVNFKRSSKVLMLYKKITAYMFVILIFSALAILLVFHVTTKRWVNTPLSIVKSILAENQIHLVNKLKNSPGEFSQIGILFDQFIKQKEELKLAKERAEESERLKTAFLANMSHEIRTPMNGILGFANLLKEPKLSGEQQHQYVSIIEKSGERMLNIINDLINISKVEAGQMTVSCSETNINEQMAYIYTFFNPEAEKKNIKLILKNALDYTESIIETDKEKLYAILTNLVKNAIKFTDKGYIEFGYNVMNEHTGKTSGSAELMFYVKDTGIGIQKEKQQVIFDRFIQADLDNKRAFQGAGLGLSITKAFVELLGGKIWLDSIPNEGSQFYFTVPFIQKTIKLQDENKTPIDKEYELKKKLTILVVEDEEIVQVYLNTILANFSKEIFRTSNGVEAVEIFAKNPHIDLILMDIQLPKMNGYDATRLIRTINKDVVIISQTAYALSGDREKAIDAGCNDYIAKPIKTELLFELIQKYFKNIL